MIKWFVRAVVLVVAAYLLLAAVVTAAMLQPPARFGQIMRYVPAPWSGACCRPSHLALGPPRHACRMQPAPEFTLPTPIGKGT